MLVFMGGRITQRKQGIEGFNRITRFGGGIHRLRFVDNDNGVGFGNQFNRALPFESVIGTVNDIRFVFFFRVGKAFTKRLNVNDHNLNMARFGKVTHLLQIGRIINKSIASGILIKLSKMFFGHLNRLVHAFFNR